MFKETKVRGVCDGVGFLSSFGMCCSIMLGYNHQHQQNSTSEETGLSCVLGTEQCNKSPR